MSNYTAYDQGQIDRALGDVRVSLPHRFQQKLSALIAEELADQSPRVNEHLQEALTVSIGGTLKSFEAVAVLQKQREREQLAASNRQVQRKRSQLVALKRYHGHLFDRFFNRIIKRSLSNAQAALIFAEYMTDVHALGLMDSERALLIEEGTRIYEKRLTLRGGSTDAVEES